MYLLDANIFIQSNRSHYGLDFVPGFWEWLDSGHAGSILCSIDPIAKEIGAGTDDLSVWAAARAPMFSNMDSACAASLTALAKWATTAPVGFTPAAIATFLASGDYQLVAYAHAHGHTVVTYERSEPNSKKRVKIPDACNALSVPCIDPFTMMRAESVRLKL